MQSRRLPILLAAATAWVLALAATALAAGVPLNAFQRPGDLHVDFPTYSAPQQEGSGGHNDSPPEGLLREVGDVNGDGRADLAMAISSAQPSWTTAVWVTFTPGVLPTSTNVTDPTWPGLKIVVAGRVISGIAGMGDVNGDGFADVAVAAGGQGVWVIFGGPAPATVDVDDLGTRGFTIANASPRHPSGGGNLWTGVFSRDSSITAVGDQNGDGRTDLAITESSRVRVVYTPAAPAGAVVDASQLGAGGATVDAPPDASTFRADTLGDTDGDGRPDMIFAWSRSSDGTVGTAGGTVAGAPLPPAGTEASLSELASSPSAFRLTASTGWVEQMLPIGDDNGDGRRDMQISLVDGSGRHVLIAYGPPPGTQAELRPLTPGAGRDIQEMYSGITDVGDQDGDGRDDHAYEPAVVLSSTGEYVHIDQSLPECVELKKLGTYSSLVLCSLEYKIAAKLPDSNGDGKPEIVAIHADPLPVQDGVTRATWRLDVFPSAPRPQPTALETPVALPDGALEFVGEFVTAPQLPTRSLAARATVAVADMSGRVAKVAGDIVDAGAAATTRAKVQATAAKLNLAAGQTYYYRMSLENGRGLTGVTDVRAFTYKPGSASPVAPAGRRMVGTRRADRLRGTRGPDVMLGRGGNDLITALGGADRLDGGTGRDRLSGGTGDDRLTGGPGRDRMRAGAGNDRLAAADRHADVVDCGRGRDVATVDRRDRTIGCERVRRR